jgi:hypothetical protein
MAIDIGSEQVFPLSEAPRRLGLKVRRARGPATRRPDNELCELKYIHCATFFRWSNKGCRGVVLETIQAGGTRCTSLEAIQRFFDALANADPSRPARSVRTPAARRRAIEKADKELAQIGL